MGDGEDLGDVSFINVKKKKKPTNTPGDDITHPMPRWAWDPGSWRLGLILPLLRGLGTLPCRGSIAFPENIRENQTAPGRQAAWHLPGVFMNASWGQGGAVPSLPFWGALGPGVPRGVGAAGTVPPAP